MNELPYYYTVLFNAATDAIALIDEKNYGCAKDVLINGQLWAEELYISEQEGELTDEKKLETWMRAGAKKAAGETTWREKAD